MHYRQETSRRILDRFRWESEGWVRKLTPTFMVFTLGFVLFAIITDAGNPWLPRLVAFFMLGVCNLLLLYVRPDLRFDLYRRYWPIKLHPLARAEADLLHRQLRQLAFSMGDSRAEGRSPSPGTPAELGEAR